jgi:aspartate carbamoyltransferase catalytic subunit
MPSPDEQADEACAESSGYEPMNKMKGRVYGAPHISRLLSFSANNLTVLGVKNPMDAPYALANSIYIASLEEDGKFRVENEAELEEKINIQDIVRRARLAEEKAEKAEKDAENRSKTHKTGKKSSGLATPEPDLS